jgi:acyl-coenzyme A synthetase/AMP-(fatty) acid ligase
MQEGRDQWFNSFFLDETSDNNVYRAEDPLFIYFWFTGKPRDGAYHSGLRGYTAYTFKMFLIESDVFWCTADISLS